jgi:protoheme IX farnesyltransferase
VATKARLVELLDSGRPLREAARGLTSHISLAKPSLSHVMAASALTAYAARRPALELAGLETIFWLLVLCLGAATLNNYQDRDIDRLLRRTRGRPLASGEIGSWSGLAQAAVLILAGTLGLAGASGSAVLPVIGLAAVGVYNFVYTPLKRKSVLAIIPGAVCGALPVLMGWMAAGGGLESPQLWILVVVLAVWQLPHFWLVVLENQRDYRVSGIPNMLGVLSVEQLRRLVFLWATSFVVLTLLLPLYRVTQSAVAAWVLSANALVLASVFAFFLIRPDDRASYRGLFRFLNLSLALVMGVVMLDCLLRA